MNRTQTKQDNWQFVCPLHIVATYLWLPAKAVYLCRIFAVRRRTIGWLHEIASTETNVFNDEILPQVSGRCRQASETPL